MFIRGLFLILYTADIASRAAVHARAVVPTANSDVRSQNEMYYSN